VFDRKASIISAFLTCFVITDMAQAQTPTRRAQARPVAAAPVILNRSSDADLYAATLAGRFAQGTDNQVLAAQAWSRAYVRRPTDRDLFEKAVSACLLSGDVSTAVRLSKLAPPSLHNEYAALALAAEAFAQGRFGDVTRVLADHSFQPSQRVFADHLAAYALLGQNKRTEAVEKASRATGIPALDKATLMSRAMVLDLAGRGNEADILFQSALNTNGLWPMGVRYYGDWLILQDRRADAVSMYQRLVQAGGLEASGFAASLAQAQANRTPPPKLDVRATAASGLVTIAQSLAAEGRGGAPIALFHLITHLDSRSDGASVALANQLVAESRGDIAQPLLLRVPTSSPDYLSARRELVWLVFDEDQNKAVSLAREALAAQPGDSARQRLLADILAANRNDVEAERLYSDLIEKSKTTGQANEEVWPLYFGRGGTRERLNNWAGALSDLRFAKAAAPNQASVLNYLGYAMADRGENIDEALVMLRTAVRLRPRSGSIMDSLGWALYKAGRYEEAVATLETAASMAPAVSEITEHLGDAYWRTGREDEARMEWARVLRLETTPLQKQNVTIKLRDGLPVDPANAARRALAAQTGATARQ
jgi:Flp pilus assembly protein TadD